jgi:hypothetical protein
MAQKMMVRPDGRVLIPSFVDGGKIKTIPPRPMTTERDIWAHAQWLNNHGRSEEAEAFLDDAVEQMH